MIEFAVVNNERKAGNLSCLRTFEQQPVSDRLIIVFTLAMCVCQRIPISFPLSSLSFPAFCTSSSRVFVALPRGAQPRI